MEVTSVTLPTYVENLKRAYWNKESIQKKILYTQQLQQALVQTKNQSSGQFKQHPQFQQRP